MVFEDGGDVLGRESAQWGRRDWHDRWGKGVMDSEDAPSGWLPTLNRYLNRQQQNRAIGKQFVNTDESKQGGWSMNPYKLEWIAPIHPKRTVYPNGNIRIGCLTRSEEAKNRPRQSESSAETRCVDRNQMKGRVSGA